MKLLYVEWIDASVVGDQWTSLEDAHSLASKEPYTCKTVGYLVSEERIGTPRHTVYLTMTDGGDEVGPQIEIPVSTIVSRREIDVKGRNSQEGGEGRE